jgi:hypothetical protein
MLAWIKVMAFWRVKLARTRSAKCGSEIFVMA